MTNRTRQHQIEDISRNQYSSIIPDYWVFRDKNKDYGIDGEVEIFGPNGKATGLLYFVQLKATDNKDKNKGKKLDLNIESLNYYKSLEVPVLIVRYLVKQDEFYCKWAHEIDTYYGKKGAKTFRVNFNDGDLWSDDYHEIIIEHLNKLRFIKTGKLHFPIPTYLDIDTKSLNKTSRAVLLSEFRTKINEYSEIIKIESEKENAYLYVTIDNSKIHINLSSVTDCTHHGISKITSEHLIEVLTENIVIGIAICLANIGQIEKAAVIFLDDRIKKSFFDREEYFIRYLPELILSSKYSETIDAICDEIENRTDNILEAVATSAMILTKKPIQDKENKFLLLLKKCLEKSISLKEDVLIGISHYNLGNYYRSINEDKLSIKHYILAKRYDPNYLKRHYYLSELAGVLFHINKFHFSSKLYKSAIENSAPDEITPLYADALMFSGKYKKAYDVFDSYINSTSHEIDPEWLLKHHCLGTLVKDIGAHEQTRNTKKAMDAVNIDDKNIDNEKLIDEIEDALEFDFLSGYLWYNLGISHSQLKNHEQSAFCFCMCSICQPHDIEAWSNAATCCLNIGNSEAELFSIIILTAFRINGDEFLRFIYDVFKDKLDEVSFEKFTNTLDKVLSKELDKRENTEVRIFDANNIMPAIVKSF